MRVHVDSERCIRAASLAVSSPSLLAEKARATARVNRHFVNAFMRANAFDLKTMS